MRTKKELEKILAKEKSAILIVNTHSRKGRRLFFQALDELTKRGINVNASYLVHHSERLPEIMKEAISLRIKMWCLESCHKGQGIVLRVH